jgi:hypothetical protein
MEVRIVEMLCMGLHWSWMMSRQMLPSLQEQQAMLSRGSRWDSAALKHPAVRALVDIGVEDVAGEPDPRWLLRIGLLEGDPAQEEGCKGSTPWGTYG